ncbi:MAG: hypothetical protein DHS20C13_30400 [Thermodesulfobacteriota bacterium]|nr:MAG: hypothetical protein DHS20C13_30400 [Thermodesulfobacteriota bacterium]
MNGSKMMFYKVKLCLWVLIFSTPPSFAEELNNSDNFPAIDFLEFLGEWSTDEGDWIDPENLENEDIGKLIEATIEINNEN